MHGTHRITTAGPHNPTTPSSYGAGSSWAAPARRAMLSTSGRSRLCKLAHTCAPGTRKHTPWMPDSVRSQRPHHFSRVRGNTNSEWEMGDCFYDTRPCTTHMRVPDAQRSSCTHEHGGPRARATHAHTCARACARTCTHTHTRTHTHTPIDRYSTERATPPPAFTPSARGALGVACLPLGRHLDAALLLAAPPAAARLLAPCAWPTTTAASFTSQACSRSATTTKPAATATR
jgi:hypothetical protein